MIAMFADMARTERTATMTDLDPLLLIPSSGKGGVI